MVRGSPRVVMVCALAAGLVGSLIAFAAADDQLPAAATKHARHEAVTRPKAAVAKPRALLASFDPLTHVRAGDHYESALEGGAHAELSLNVALQERVEKILRDYAVPFGALVAIEPSSGRVLAYVSHSTANPEAGDLARDPTPPAASVFKVVTSSALVDHGVSPDTRVCYGGGSSRLMAIDLEDDPRRDRACATLAEALGGSINTVFAKLADRNLDGVTLRRYAEAFGFGQKLVFDVPVTPSAIEVPSERLELARTAAGFWHMHMSPLQGALIASTIANGGVMPKASMIERIVDANGKVLQTFRAEAQRQVIGRNTARIVGRMMLRTVAEGTAHSAFFERGKPFLPNIDVAGKTGSLSAESPYRAYSWWVGFAPADQPKVALAALIVNTPKWRIKGSFLAREALRELLVEQPKRAAKAAKAKPAVTPASAAPVATPTVTPATATPTSAPLIPPPAPVTPTAPDLHVD